MSDWQTYADGARNLASVVGWALVIFLLVKACTGCAYGEPYETPADAGADVADADPCARCWAWCGHKDRTNAEVIVCAGHTCPEVCGR